MRRICSSARESGSAPLQSARSHLDNYRHCTAALPLPARDERGEGRGEGL